MTAIRMDARVTRQEVHSYFAEGGRKFEQLASNWQVTDIQRLKATGDGSPRPAASRGTLRHEDDVSAALVSCGEAPGYRDVRLTLECEVIGDDRASVGPVRLNVSLGPGDGLRVMEHVQTVHRFAWSRPGHRPLDAKPGETPPRWIGDTST